MEYCIKRSAHKPHYLLMRVKRVAPGMIVVIDGVERHITGVSSPALPFKRLHWQDAVRPHQTMYISSNYVAVRAPRRGK